MIGDSAAIRQLTDPGMLENVQPRCDCRREFQGIKLRLTGEFYCAGDRERKRKRLRELCRIPKLLKSAQFFLDLLTVVESVDKGILFLEIAGDICAQIAVGVKSVFVGAQIHLGSLHAKPADQLTVDQPMAVNGWMTKLAKNDILNKLASPVIDVQYSCASASATPNRWAEDLTSRPMSFSIFSIAAA